jgi:hypothetical protein
MTQGKRQKVKVRRMPFSSQRGKDFAFATLARSAETIVCNARLGHPFSLVSGARSAEKFFAFATLLRAARRKKLER